MVSQKANKGQTFTVCPLCVKTYRRGVVKSARRVRKRNLAKFSILRIGKAAS